MKIKTLIEFITTMVFLKIAFHDIYLQIKVKTNVKQFYRISRLKHLLKHGHIIRREVHDISKLANSVEKLYKL